MIGLESRETPKPKGPLPGKGLWGMDLRARGMVESVPKQGFGIELLLEPCILRSNLPVQKRPKALMCVFFLGGGGGGVGTPETYQRLLGNVILHLHALQSSP